MTRGRTETGAGVRARRKASPSSATRSMARWSMTAAPHAPSFLSIAEPDDAVFVIGSFSKPWAMTGWRIGWLVHPASLATAMGVMAQANNTGPAHFLQYGALAALSPQGDVFRGELLARCAAGPRGGGGFPQRPEPHPLDEAGWRLLRLPACRRVEGQPGVRAGDGAERRRWAWRRARPFRWAIRATKPICASASPRMPASWRKGWAASPKP